jgi:hypothetical protein
MKSLCMRFLFPIWVALGAHAEFFESHLQDFSTTSYQESVENLFQSFEKDHPDFCQKQPKGSVGIKASTVAGEGLSTPLALVEGVITALEKRGYKRESIIIWDKSAHKLRAAGLLPPLSAFSKPIFKGCPVKSFDDPSATDPNWFYESKLAPNFAYAPRYPHPITSLAYAEEMQRSYLPVELFLDVDFWIHLPVALEHPSLGPWCALADRSVGAITNSERFFSAPRHLSVACAEIASIPELKNAHLFTILSLECAQYVGGLRYFPRYTIQRPLLWLSSDPVAIDEAWLKLLNRHRTQKGFEPYEACAVLEYVKGIEGVYPQ